MQEYTRNVCPPSTKAHPLASPRPSLDDTLRLWFNGGTRRCMTLRAVVGPFGPDAAADALASFHLVNASRLILQGLLIVDGDNDLRGEEYRLRYRPADDVECPPAPARLSAVDDTLPGLLRSAGLPTSGARMLQIHMVATQTGRICSQCCGQADVVDLPDGRRVRKCQRPVCGWEDEI